MEELSEDLKDHQYYTELLNELIEENDMELKNRLQKGDRYSKFINEQSRLLMDKTIALIKEQEVSFIEASSTVIEEWKGVTFH